jgi:hypothetical protein
MSGEEALRRFESAGEYPINALNNPVPQGMAENHWMADVVGYDMARRLIEQAKEEGLDLSGFLDSLRVLLMASEGAITLRHVDKNAETTCIKSRMGAKIWEISSDRSEKEVERFGEDGTCSIATFVILVDEGYELIQPPMTIHSVYTYSRSMLLCHQYLDSRTMVSILKQTLLELRCGSITNDDHHKDLPQLLDRAMKAWWKDAEMERPGLWPDAECLVLAEEIHKVNYSA